MITVGIVGAGRAATLHAEAVRAAGSARLAGVAARSSDSPRAAALAEALNSRVLTVGQLTEACDAVVVAAPPQARAEILCELAESPKLKAVMVESPAAATLDGVTQIQAAFSELPMVAAANLMHAPAVRRMLDATAAMDPHHLQMRLSLPTPAGGADDRRAFGGGVMMDQTPGFWPVLLTALGAGAESVEVQRFEIDDGIDHAVDLTIRAANGRRAAAALRWGASVAEASFEAADSRRVARVDVWPTPAVEINGVPESIPAGSSGHGTGRRAAERTPNPLAALGYANQIDYLVQVASDSGRARPRPDLATASSALAISAAAALSIRRNGAETSLSETPSSLSPLEILTNPSVA
ncbi:MAG: Gfo/Idh/MocA family oxidoreductase [Acidimicrobiaceae bacterium]|nr:Gfo/Idh/MocA family oxidoreductase [Acidimicrobiaceae bacterium]